MAAWSKSIEQWWDENAPQLPPDLHPLFEALLEQGKMYFQLLAQVNAGLARTGRDASATTRARTRQAPAKRAEKRRERPARGTPASDLLEGLVEAWRAPLELWLQQRRDTAESDVDRPEGQPPHSTRDELDAAVGSMLAQFLPWATGKRGQRASVATRRLWDEYLRALEAYECILRRTALTTLERLRVELKSPQGPAVTTPKALHKVWLRCAETAYSELVLSDEYAELYGHLVNTSMGLRAHVREMSEQAARALALPTRTEQEELAAELQALRRELRDRKRAGPRDVRDEEAGADAVAECSPRGGRRESRRK